MEKYLVGLMSESMNEILLCDQSNGGYILMALLVFQYIKKCRLRLTKIFYFKLYMKLEVKKFVGRTNIIGFFPCLVYSDCRGSFC